MQWSICLCYILPRHSWSSWNNFTAFKTLVAREIGGRVGGSHWLPQLNRPPSCLGWGLGLVFIAAPSGIFTDWERDQAIGRFGFLWGLYLSGYWLVDWRSNGSSIGWSWWRRAWCCWPRFLGSPPIGRSIAWESSGISNYWEIHSGDREIDWWIGRSMDWDIHWEIVISIGISIGRSWWRRVWCGWLSLLGSPLIWR